MIASTPLPARASLRDLLTDLLGRPATVADAPLQELDANRPAVAAVYRRDDGTVAAVGISDTDLSTHAGAAIGMVPPGEIATQPAEELQELFGEVVNVMAKLLNSPTVPHVVLREVRQLPGSVPADVAALVTNPAARIDYAVEVSGYGHGHLTLLSG